HCLVLTGCRLTFVSQLRYNAVKTEGNVMPAQTSMIHVRVDDQLKAQATDALSGVGLTVSDAVRILLTRVAAEGGLPAGLAADPDAYDAWFRAKVQDALADARPAVPHDQVMQDARARITGTPRA
ncbi:type II toxin-antitoxin system RelB family antitoxin, partial [Streptomyces javensis]